MRYIPPPPFSAPANFAIEEVLNNAMIRDVMIANPHTAKSEVILTGLDYRSIPMPDNMYNEILAGADTVSDKELLEADLSAKISDRDQAFNALTELYLEEDATVDTLIAMTESISLLQAKYLKSLYLIEKQETEQAYIAATDIPTLVSIGGRESEYLDFVSYLQLIQQYDNLDSIPLQFLEPLSFSTSEMVKASARNTMINNGSLTYKEPYLLPDGTKSARVRRTTANAAAETMAEKYLKIYPNPARGCVTVEYKLSDGAERGLISLFDITGSLQLRKILESKANQVVISLNQLKAGSYLLELSEGNTRIDSQKLIIK